MIAMNSFSVSFIFSNYVWNECGGLWIDIDVMCTDAHTLCSKKISVT